jgi:RimJ/RimL family protein N-acetyltransferase
MIIRPLASHEIATFARVGGSNTHTQDVEHYLQQMLLQGSVRLEWCFVAEEAEQIIGTLAYWALPTAGKPTDIVLLTLPWERADFLSVGTQLLGDTLQKIQQTYPIKEIGHVLDQPPMKPQWQFFPEQRLALLQHMGFQIVRNALRFEWKSERQPQGIGATTEPQRLVFRSLHELDADAFIAAIEQVSALTFDQWIQQGRELYGPKQQARDLFEDLQRMEYDPTWWQLAYTPQNELVGLVIPAKNPSMAVIGYIGVLPGFRGKGYVNDLLASGTASLYHAGFTTIRADTDVSNFPMANAFRRAGYQQFATRYDLQLPLKTL